jgi:MFS family permease
VPRLPFVRGRLWSHSDFLKLWTGQTVSRFGSQITLLAVPTLAILTLKATPLQVGLLTTLEYLPFPVLGLFAGVYADRWRRRPIMITADIARAVILASIPIAFELRHLTLLQLYAVALSTGVFTVFFDISDQSYLPALVDRTDLVEGNTKLTISYSTATLAGPAVAGFLIELVGAALAVAVDAASFVVSAVAIWSIRKPERAPMPVSAGGRRGLWTEMREGLHVVFGNSILWHIAGCTATSNLGSNMVFAVFLIFAYRHLHLTPGVIGVVFGISSFGSLVGALVARRMAQLLGVGRALASSTTLLSLGMLCTPLAQLGQPFVVLTVFLFVSQLNWYDIIQLSLRQSITPDRLQGRMNATMRTIVWGTIPIGAFLGGVLGSTLGVVETIVAGGFVSLLSVGWIVIGPVFRIREAPAPASA